MESNFNVATVSKNAKQFGLGVAVQPISFGLSSAKTKEQLYLIQDQDVIAFESSPIDPNDSLATSFGWQFRPVLGQEVVRAGTRQVYAALALPVNAGNDFAGQVEVHTYWRRYDLKKKTVGDLIPGSDSYERLDDLVVNSELLRGTPLQPKVAALDYQDPGPGKVLVWLKGENFLPGTQVIVGDQILNTADKGLFIQGEEDLRFIVSSQQLALSDQPRIIGRFGSPVPICRDYIKPDGNCVVSETLASEPEFGLKLSDLRIVPVDAQNSRVTVEVRSAHNTSPRKDLRPIAIVGSTPYGIGGVPLTIKDKGSMLELSFTAPTQSLRDAGRIRVKAPFLVKAFSDEIAVDTSALVMADDFTATSVVVLSTSEADADLAIIGTNFSSDVKVRVGDQNIAIGAVGPPTLTRSSSSLLLLHLTASQLKPLKQLVVLQGKAQPVIVSVTAPPVGIPKPTISSFEPVLENDENDVKVQGTNLTSVDKVMFRGAAVSFESAKNGLTGTLLVSKELSDSPGSKSLDFISKDGSKVTGTLVVSARPGSK
jgi:hypothetical protein